MVRTTVTAALVALVAVGAACAGGDRSRVPARDTRDRLPTREARDRQTVLGVTWRGGAARIARLDPVSLEPVAAAGLAAGRDPVAVWAFSPDRSRVALGDMASPTIRLVDVRRLAEVRILRLPAGVGAASELSWPLGDRIVALVPAPTARVFVFDARAGRITARGEVGGSVVAAARWKRGLVLLASRRAPDNAIGPAALVLADASGRVRSVDLPGVRAGFGATARKGSDETVVRQLVPGLAVDPSGERALILPPGNAAVEVDLETRAARWHALTEPVSLLARLRAWLDPPAHAKAPVLGPARDARWIGDGLVAVAGSDLRPAREAGAEPVERPAGLRIVDTRRWTVRTLDAHATAFTFAPGAEALVAHGGAPGGVRVYGVDGNDRFRLFAGRRAFVIGAAGRYAYVGLDDGDPVAVVDAAAGRVLHDDVRWPTLLAVEE